MRGVVTAVGAPANPVEARLDAGEPGLDERLELVVGEDIGPILFDPLADQFTDGPRVFALNKFTRLCVPTDKNGEGIKNANVGLMCYQAKAVKGVCTLGAPANAGGACVRELDCGGNKQTQFCEVQEKFERAVGLFVNNQLTPGQVDTTREDEFCVPSGISQLD